MALHEIEFGWHHIKSIARSEQEFVRLSLDASFVVIEGKPFL